MKMENGILREDYEGEFEKTLGECLENDFENIVGKIVENLGELFSRKTFPDREAAEIAVEIFRLALLEKIDEKFKAKNP